MSPPKIQDAVLFIKEHGVCKKWTEVAIASTILTCIENHTFLWSCDSEGKLSGIVLGQKDTEKKNIHILAIVLTSHHLLKEYIRLFRLWYPGYTLTGTRKGKLINYKRLYGRRSCTTNR